MSQLSVMTYKVMPNAPGLAPRDVRKQGADAVKALEIDRMRDSLILMRDDVRKILAQRGGVIVEEGLGYGVKGDPHEHDAFMIVECTAPTAYWLSQASNIREVNQIDPKPAKAWDADPPTPIIG